MGLPEDNLKKFIIKCHGDLQFYAAKCLKIKTKEGGKKPLIFNKAQIYVHEKIEEQLREKGFVKANILKGRQEGISTLIAARDYWSATKREGVNVFILTHLSQATSNLFKMAKYYHDNLPDFLKPVTSAASATELFFSELGSGYKVGTAGNKSTGRSDTIHYFHGSEVAFWPNAQELIAGILQAVPTVGHTEIVLESTANGQSNYFFEHWQQTEAKENDFINIFVPWHWQAEYRKKLPDDFCLSDEELDYKNAYNLDNEQIYWRRMKIAELKSHILFKQEYPANAAEAFQTSGESVYIHPDKVLAARKSKSEAFGPLVIGVDVAWDGEHSKDRTSIAIRQGRKLISISSYKNLNTVAVAGLVVKLINDQSPDAVFVDVGGIGAGVYDQLINLGYSKVVHAVNFGSSALNKSSYINRRTEMWGEMRDWFYSDSQVEIPDIDSLQADITAPIFNRYDQMGRPIFYSKAELKAKRIRSPDEADALALTFAMPVAQKSNVRNIDAIMQERQPRTFFGI
ncbi:hypothetical protein E6Q11_01795 [Candidatus Dojkabacteria bacterium]|uniref:Terminase large subunit gp17-like C-terminal domain-containing protein n=1 Tax=Candidatus Dojkabacteria bacterium TaxID=2099670 RepID=A0A5C7J9H3_9BACT|nr:MAG: hypothetical protein E6Q11_01795 [Candidatus Dojkabacteria bacterium]